MHAAGAVDEWLRRQGVAVRRDWVDQCIHHCHVHDGIDPRNLDAVKAKLFNYFLFTDLLDIGTGVLPANVEVNEFVNIAANYETRMEDGPNRMLKLSLSDGRQQVTALEFRRIPSLTLSSPAGFKIAVKRVMVKRGVLLLTPQNTTVLGGEVEKYSDFQHVVQGTAASRPAASQPQEQEQERQQQQQQQQPPPLARGPPARPPSPEVIEIFDDAPPPLHPPPAAAQPRPVADNSSDNVILDFTTEDAGFEFDYEVWNEMESEAMQKARQPQPPAPVVTTATATMAMTAEVKPQPRRQAAAARKPQPFVTASALHQQAVETIDLVHDTRPAAPAALDVAESKRAMDSPSGLGGIARQLSFTPSPSSSTVAPPPAAVQSPVATSHSSRAQQPPPLTVSSDRHPFSHLSVVLASPPGTVGRVKAKAVGQRVFKPSKEGWDIVIDFEDHSGCVPARVDNKFCEVIFGSTAADFRKLVKATDKAARDGLISEKLRRLQVMDGIFTVERLRQPEPLEDGTQIQLLVTGQPTMSAATAARSLLPIVEHALG